MPPEPSASALHLLYSCMEQQEKRDPDTRAPVPLTSDVVFKYVFGGEQSTMILRSLLSAVQEDAGYAPVASVEIRNPFNEKDADDAKLSFVDVRARDITGAVYSVEMQAYHHRGFFSRVLYYWAKAYGDQLAEGDLYTRLRPVVSVNFLSFTVFPAETGAPLHTVFLPACRNAPQVEPLQDMVLHFLDLPMFAARFADTSATLPSTALERWLYYIVRRGTNRAMEDPIMKKILEESPDIAAAERRYGQFIADEQLRSRMDARDKFIRTNAQLLHDAKEEGWEAGVRDTVRGMKEKGITVETIAEITGLSADNIAEL